MGDMTKEHFLGYGLGLRPEHYDDILSADQDRRVDVDWFEILSENYMVPGGKPLWHLDRVRERYPLVMHGVSMSIGSTDPLDREYLKDLKALAERVEPCWISDHLCWTGQGGHNLHDLMPLPYCEDSLDHVVDRVGQVQDFLGRQILLENVSSYLSYKKSDMTEWDFLSEVATRADCLILLDINNIFVSAFNHEFDPLTYLEAIPASRVRQFHLAGHQHNGDYIIDTHDQDVPGDVWQLYRRALKKFGPVSSMIERDDQIPPFQDLVAELEIARKIGAEVLS
ncbi:DUF692 domain-containing protein [Emcibacter sp.]|uniref:MNIO family bufferin maturase n=1 Tax=Emcibacter sp. TaxID=1979954 RepID=UPI002AA933E8|nr:DUF692 domain-containing protein [Emcibacter sp.]